VPLCLLTPDMQNRRILNRLLSQEGPAPMPTMESNSMIALVAHVRTGKWASVMPENIVRTLGLEGAIHMVPIVAPEVTHTIGLVVVDREPLTPLCDALMREATRIVPALLD